MPKLIIPKIGDKYGDWTIISDIPKKASEVKNSNVKNYCWKVRCKCGIESWIQSETLKRHKSNGCKSCSKYHSPYELGKTYFNNIKSRAIYKKFDFDLTIEYLWDLFLSQDRKCKLSNLEIKFSKYCKGKDKQTASLDRIDNTKGYIKGNVQWVHKDINNMKYTFTEEYFKKLCVAVASKCG